MGYYWDHGISAPPPPPATSTSSSSQTTLLPSSSSGINDEIDKPTIEQNPDNLTQREIGNQLFVNGEYEEALKRYGVALASGEKMELDDVDGGEDEDENNDASSINSPLEIHEIIETDARAVLHCNRAACYLKLVQKVWNLPQGGVGVNVWNLSNLINKEENASR